MYRISLWSARAPVRAVALGASGLLLAASAALAAGDAAAPPQARYQSDRAACLSGQSAEDQATCLREAAAAREEARRGRLDNGVRDYERNATLRCQPLPEDQRRDCLARMHGQGTTSGSVEEGGIYREMVTREIGAPPDAGSSSSPSSTVLPAAPPPTMPAEPMPAPRTPAP